MIAVPPRQTQPIGGLGVGAATRHLDQDLALAVGELVHPFVDR